MHDVAEMREWCHISRNSCHISRRVMSCKKGNSAWTSVSCHTHESVMADMGTSHDTSSRQTSCVWGGGEWGDCVWVCWWGVGVGVGVCVHTRLCTHARARAYTHKRTHTQIHLHKHTKQALKHTQMHAHTYAQQSGAHVDGHEEDIH